MPSIEYLMTLMQKCQISYYPEPHYEIVLEVVWDEREQGIAVIQGNRFQYVRSEDIEGDLTMRDVISHFGYGNCYIHTQQYYVDLGLDVNTIMETTVRELHPVQIEIYRNMEVFLTMNPINQNEDEYEDEYEDEFYPIEINPIEINPIEINIENIIDNDENLALSINIEAILTELQRIAIPELYINYFDHDEDYETIAHEVALYVLNE